MLTTSFSLMDVARQRAERWLSLLLIGVLLCASVLIATPPRPMPIATPAVPRAVPPALPTDDTPTAPAAARAPALMLPPELAGKPEIAALRTASSATFDMGNGTYALVQDSVPLHYQDATGVWQPINPAFTPVAGGWVDTRNTLHTSLAERTSSAKIASGAAGTGWEPVDLLAEGPNAQSALATLLPEAQTASGTRSADGRAVRYGQSWNDSAVQDQWRVGAGSTEYTVRLAALPAGNRQSAIGNPQSLDLRVRLHLRPGTNITVAGKPIALPLDTDQPLTFTDGTSDEFLLQLPAAYEQNNPLQRVAGRYVLSATDDPATLELRVRFPWRWLAAPERQFPVILDPLFQNKTLLKARSAVYDTALNFQGYDDTAPLKLGKFADKVYRLLVVFGVPTMPDGTSVTSAHILAVPVGAANNNVAGPSGVYTANGIANGEFQLALMHAYPLTSGSWTGTQPPAFDPNAPISGKFGPDVGMTYSKGLSGQLGADWDITPQWFTVGNNGAVLTLKDEHCQPDPVKCGGFTFPSPPQWDNDELNTTQTFSKPDSVWPLGSRGSGGVRLVVFYSGPQLNLGQVVTREGASLNPSGEPFFRADHEYRFPPVPQTQWQAFVARGFAPTIGAQPPTEGSPFLRPLRGSFPLRIYDDNDKQVAETATSGGVGYVLMNGAAAPNANYRARLSEPGGTPLGYDARLIGQAGTVLNPQYYTPAVVNNYIWDSDQPLGIWRVTIPANSNSRISIATNGTFFNYNQPLQPGFQAQLFRADAGAVLTPKDAYRELKSNSDASFYSQKLGTPMFSTGSAAESYALAMSYSGPLGDVVPPPPPPPRIVIDGAPTDTQAAPDARIATPGEPTRLQFSVTVRVSACPARDADGDPTFPDANGNCIKVKCPNSTFDVANNYREFGGLGLWSFTGWRQDNFKGDIVNDGNVAPMLGPVGRGAPTVAVLGSLNYFSHLPNQKLNTDGIAMLVNCGSPGGAGSNPDPIEVFGGSLSRTDASSGAVLTGNGIVQVDPWTTGDRRDLQPPSSGLPFFIAPGAGTANGAGQLTRAVGNNLRFAVSWSITARDGWGGLASAATGGGSTSVAGLTLDSGVTFSLDASPSGSDAEARKQPRTFTRLRASAATITQPDTMGGASKPVQALISPRGERLDITSPGDETNKACYASDKVTALSCVDLRATDDTPQHPNRSWVMPDIHVTGQAGVVTMSSAGVLKVYSKDHPNAQPTAANDIDTQFSYDTFGAKVSVKQEACDPGGPTVTVIRGATMIALPNIGSGANQSNNIASTFKLCQTSLREVTMTFSAQPGVAIGNSGMFLTSLGGKVTISPTFTRIELDVAFQIGDGSLAQMTGKVTIDTRGLFQFQGQVGLLRGVMGGQGSLWVAWNPLDIGFRADVCYPFKLGSTDPCADSWVKGTARAHMWKGQGWLNRYSFLPDNDETHMAAQISATLKIKQGQIFSWWFLDLPPSDTSLGAEVAFGQFCTSGGCATYEWGIKGKLTILGYDVGLYYSFGSDISSPTISPGNLSFILGNDSHVLVDQYGGATDVPSVQVANGDAPLRVQAGPRQVDGEVRVPITVNPGVEGMLTGASWQAGVPTLTLIAPDGTEVTPDNAGNYGAAFQVMPSSTLIGLKNPAVGAWQLKLSGLSAEGVEHYRIMAFTNKGAPVKPGENPFTAPAITNENGTSGYTLTWNVAPGTSDSATISLFSTRANGTAPGNLDQDVPIVQNLPFKAGTYTWDTRGLANGSYQVYAVLDDGVNSVPPGSTSEDACAPAAGGLPTQRAFDPNRFPGTAVFTATGTVQINDTTPPALPTGLTLLGVDDAVLARWDAPTDRKIVAYELLWAFPYTDPFGTLLFDAQTQRVTASEAPQLRIGGRTNGVPTSVQVRAVDVNGLKSPYTAILQAVPSATDDPVPNAPVNLANVNTNGTGTGLTWNAGDDPAPAIYRVTYNRLGSLQQVQVTTTDLSATINGLTPGMTYVVRVQGLNKAGWPSAPSDSLTFTATDGVDANGDGLPDDWAAAYGVTGGATGDADGDGFNNIDEFNEGTNPEVQDTDGDGFTDGEEIAAGTNDFDRASYGSTLTQPRLTLATDRLTFRAKRQAGGEAAPQTVTWSNSGGGMLTLDAASSAPWIQASVQGDGVQVGVNSIGMRPGFHSGVVRLTAAGGAALAGPPACIRVNAWFAPADDDKSNGMYPTVYMPMVERH